VQELESGNSNKIGKENFFIFQRISIFVLKAELQKALTSAEEQMENAKVFSEILYIKNYFVLYCK
jgi:hypothetical protein